MIGRSDLKNIAPFDSAHRTEQPDIDFRILEWLLKFDPQTPVPESEVENVGKRPRIMIFRSNVGRKHSNTPSKRILSLWSDLFLGIVEYYRESVLYDTESILEWVGEMPLRNLREKNLCWKRNKLLLLFYWRKWLRRKPVDERVNEDDQELNVLEDVRVVA